jgi:RNA 2',3'-cyclic 3'-phosphodiesterase
MRLFVAAELPEPVREALAAWARGALGRGEALRRIDPDALHLTLCFLGEQPPSAVGVLTSALEECAEPLAAVDELSVGPPVWLPPRRPRVLAVEISDPLGALRALHAALTEALEDRLGWERRRERFRPHVTVARMRPGSQRVRELPPTPALRFAPVAATLLRSTLHPDGARYDPLATVALPASSVRGVSYGDFPERP